MKKLLVFFGIFSFFVSYTQKADAIIILPAIVLIPIAKIVAILIGSMSIPAIGFGTLWSKLFKKSAQKTIFIIILLIILLAVLISIYLKVENPTRPIF